MNLNTKFQCSDLTEVDIPQKQLVGFEPWICEQHAHQYECLYKMSSRSDHYDKLAIMRSWRQSLIFFLHTKSYKSIYRNALIKWEIFVLNLNMPTIKWEGVENPTWYIKSLRISICTYISKFEFWRETRLKYDFIAAILKIIGL